MGLGDAIRGAILGVVPGDAANKINKALTPGTTSGMDAAMQSQADKLHPTSGGNGITRRPDGSLKFPLDGN